MKIISPGIRTLGKTRFDQECSNRIRENPVPEGVLQYFKKEIKSRRKKLIEEAKLKIPALVMPSR